MTLKKIAVTIVTALALIATSCTKDPDPNSGSGYLKFSNATVHVANKQGARGAVMVESNISWQLSVEAPAPGWMVLNKLAGSNSDSLVVTATEDNTTGGYKFATIIATPVNNSAILPVRLTVVQYDSTYKGK
jgi:hypothetical protein